MSEKSLQDLAKKMKGIDIAFLSTKTEGGEIASRPMSNNGDVEYDGDSYYFTYDGSLVASDVAKDPRVSLSFTGKSGIVSGPSFYATVEGEAELISDRQALRDHWTGDLDVWFDRGVETPGLVLLKVHAHRIKFWDGVEHGEVLVR